MTVKQVIKLMRAGYSPAEIRELQDPDATLDLIEAGATKDNVRDFLDCIRDPEAAGEDQPESEHDSDEDQPDNDQSADEDQPDYKALYEQSQATLKAAQAANNRQEITGSDTKTAADVITDYIINNL